jgi:hypothetical protein
MLTILCIATYFKGEAFLRECRRAGCAVLLLTNEQLTNADWPRDVIDEIHGIAREADDAAVRRAADAIVRRHPVDRIAATTSTSKRPRCCASTFRLRAWAGQPRAGSATS